MFRNHDVDDNTQQRSVAIWARAMSDPGRARRSSRWQRGSASRADGAAIADILRPFVVKQGPNFCEYRDESAKTSDASLVHGPEGVDGACAASGSHA